MPGRSLTGSENYRYAFQGQERDPETGKEAFELRLWDGRIGRWLSPDPYGQYFSPYLGMGNNPISGIDPDGGWFWKSRAVKAANQMGLSKSDVHWKGLFKGGWGFYADDKNYYTGNEEALIIVYWVDNDKTYSKVLNLKYSDGLISEWKPNITYDWNRSDNILKKFSYDTANGFYTTSQFFMGRSVGGSSMINLDGTCTTTKEGLDGFISTASFGYGKLTNGLGYAKPFVSNGKLWNIYQSTTKGIYNSRLEAGYAYRILVREMNQMIFKHNIGVGAAKNGNTILDITQKTSYTIDFIKKH